MRPKGSPDLIADRRRRSLSLLDEGFSLHEVARRVGCHASSVMRWRDEYEKRGEESFAVRFSPGRPPRLTERHLKRLGSLLLKGAVANGYRTEIWTTKRIAEVIAREWRVRYHPDHIGRLMAKLGWTHQKPTRRAAERNEEAIRRWVSEEWPRVKKTPLGWVPISPSSTNPASF
jgi:transposase